MSWKPLLASLLAMEHDRVDQSSVPELLQLIFRDMAKPEVIINAEGLLHIPDDSSILIGGGSVVHSILSDTVLFLDLPLLLRKGLLDTMYLLCRGGIYDIARLRYFGEQPVATSDVQKTHNLQCLLLRLLHDSMASGADILVSKRIIRLFGALSTAGISISDLKSYLKLLKSVTPLSLSLLQSLKLMMTQDDKVSKASPGSFFNFGGNGSGLVVESPSFPFTREYHILFWFRVDSVCKEHQHLLTIMSEAFLGIDIYMSGKTLHIGTRPTKSDNQTDVALTKKTLVSGVWYRLSVQHTKPRMNLLGFSKDSMTVHLDNEQVYQDPVPFPSSSHIPDVSEFIIGKDLNGQMGPVFLFSEILPMNAVEYIFRVTAGKSADGVNAVDLVQSITLGDKTKVVNMFSKLSSGFHPSRFLSGRVVDISGGRHGRLGPLTQTWNVEAPRDVLVSLGGINCVLPLFPRLIVENEYVRTGLHSSSNIDVESADPATASGPVSTPAVGAATRSNLGTSLSELCRDILTDPVISQSLRSEIEMLSVEYSDTGSIGLLFTIIARCLRLHYPNQRDVVRLKAIEMIEYALLCVPTEVLQDEAEGCVRAILELQTAVQDFPAIDITIMRHILCNFKVWSRTLFQYQSSLMGVVLALIRAQPDRYLHIMGVEWLLDCMYTCYAENVDIAIEEAASEDKLVSALEDSVVVETVEDEIFLDTTSRGMDDDSVIVDGLSSTPFPETAENLEPTDATLSVSTSRPSALEIRRESSGGFSSLSSKYNTPQAESAKELNRDHEIDVFDDSVSAAIPPTHGCDSSDGSFPRSTSSSKINSYARKSVRGSFYRTVSMRVTSIAGPAHDSDVLPEGKDSSSGDQGKSIGDGDYRSFESDDYEAEVVARVESGDSLRLKLTPDVSYGDTRERNNDFEAGAVYNSGDKDFGAVDIESVDSAHIRSRNNTSNICKDKDDSALTRANEAIETDTKSEPDDGASALSAGERFYLRNCLQTMLMSLIQQGSSAREIIPVLNFIGYCKDLVVVNEIAHLLLCAIVEGDMKIVVAITEASHGPEEFAGFVISRLVNQPIEQLRCTGIRLLTHYYLRINSMPAAALNLRLKRRTAHLMGRSGKLSRARDSFMHTSDQVGLNRLEACGGLAQVWKSLMKYTDESTELTYSALLEMLLTTSAASNQISVQSKHFFEDARNSALSSGAHTGVTTQSGGLMQTPLKFSQTAQRRNSSIIPQHEHGSSITQRNVIFAPNSSNPQTIADLEENQQCTLNPCVLSLFCHFLPKFSMEVHERIYLDLFGLLKNNSKNLEVFYSHPSWNLCMYDLVSQLIVVTSVCTSTVLSADVCSILEGWALLENFHYDTDVRKSPVPSVNSPKRTAPPGKLLRQWQRSASFRDSDDGSGTNGSPRKRTTSENNVNGISNSAAAKRTGSGGGDVVKGDIDVLFDIAVKIYATVLLHGLDSKGGWRDIQQTIALSYDSIHGTAVTYAVFSHLMNEMTFIMRPKYKEINKMAQSKNADDNADATTKLENMLAHLLLTSEFLLETQPGQGDIESVTIRQDNVRSLRGLRRDFEGNTASSNGDETPVESSRYPRFVNDEGITTVRKVGKGTEEGITSGNERESYPMGLLESLVTQSFTDPVSGDQMNDSYIPTSVTTVPPSSAYGMRSKQPSQDERVMSSVFEADGGISGGMQSFSHTASFTHTAKSTGNSFNNSDCDVIVDDDDADLFDDESPSKTEDKTDVVQAPLKKLRKRHQHKWIDLRVNAGYPPQTDGISGLFSRNPSDSPPGKEGAGLDNSTDCSKKVNAEVLGPLGRGFEFPKGKIILVLQTLRFFDLIFWPSEQKIRNSHLLNFDRTVVEGMVSNVPADSTSNSLVTDLTIHSAAIRLCLYVMSALSPFSEMAELNIRRLRAIIRVPPITPSTTSSAVDTDGIPSCTGPTVDCCICAGGSDRARPLSEHWVLVILAYAVKTLQRLNAALQPVYMMIGVRSGQFGFSSLGFLSTLETACGLNTSDDSGHSPPPMDTPQVNLEDDEFEKILMDLAVIQDVDALFNTLTGRRLVQYISSIVGLVVDMYEIGKTVFAETLGDEEFFKYTLLVQRHQNTQLKLASFFQHTGNERLSDPLHDLDLQKQSVSGKKDSRDTLFRRSRAQTQFEYFVTPEETSTERGSPSPLTRGQRSSSMPLQAIPEQSSQPQAGASTQSSGGRQTEENFGRDVVALLRWLRDPFLVMDVMHNPCIIGSIRTIEMCEMNWTNNFLSELISTRNMSEQQRHVDRKVADEARELQELSVEVTAAIVSREESRLRDIQSLEQVKIKASAAGWYKCMKMFEASWSPWSDMSHQASHVATAREHFDPIEKQHTISTHRDAYKRRMLTVRAIDPVDHSQAAYLDGKQRDQKAFEAGIELNRDIDVIAEQPTKFYHGIGKRAGHVPTPLLTSSTNNVTGTVTTSTDNYRKGNIAAWGDDEDDDEEADAACPPDGNTADSAVGGPRLLFSTTSEPKPLWSLIFRWKPDERIVFKEQALMIKTEHTQQGTILLTNYHVYFHPKKVVGGLNVKNASMMDERWRLDQLRESFARRYLLQNCAIELFFVNNFEVFFAFKSLASLKRFFRYLRRQSTPLLVSPGSLNPRHVFQNTNWTELWRKRQISNFEYLMRLNIISGRSYNDVTQYPVFPWIIQDYTSSVLDLTDPNTFRDLSKPVGALNEERLADILERYRSLDDDMGIPKFMYGSHYSSAGVVLHYLVRQEPFTSLNISLQGGRLDCPDRIFFNVKYSWDGCNRSMSDVKELIPEFYCFPEFLINSNNLPLGELQDDLGVVDDVVLPNWAKTPFEFVQMNREALESEYVSEHLHEWIDLIFGYKQTGPAAVDANNVFYYLTYENAIQLDKIEDPLQREAAKSQVIHFGQTPTQLLSKEHPKRLPREECMTHLFSLLTDETTARLQMMKVPILRTAAIAQSMSNKSNPVVSMKCCGDRIVAVLSDLSVVSYSWSAYPSGVNVPFQLRIDKVRTLPSVSLSVSRALHLRPVHSSDSDSVSRRSSAGSTTDVGPLSLDSDGSESPGIFSNTKSLFGGLLSRSRAGSTSTNTRPVSIPLGTDKDSPAKLETRPVSSSSEGARSTSLAVPGDISCLDVSDKLVRELTALEAVQKLDAHTTSDSTLAATPHDERPVVGKWNVAIAVQDSGYCRVCSCCYWDSTLKIHAAENLREISASTGGHLGPITCLEVGDDGRVVISGGSDGTCRMWVLESASYANALAQEEKSYTFEDEKLDPAVLACVHVMWGHDSAISALSYSTHHDLLLSGSTGGGICLHTVSNGNFVRSIYRFRGQKIESVLVTMHGYLIVHTDSMLSVFWINGEFLCDVELPCRLENMCLNRTENVLVCGSSNGMVSIVSIPNLHDVRIFDLSKHGRIRSLCNTTDGQYMIVGSEDGSIHACFDPEGYFGRLNATLLRQRTHDTISPTTSADLNNKPTL